MRRVRNPWTSDPQDYEAAGHFPDIADPRKAKIIHMRPSSFLKFVDPMFPEKSTGYEPRKIERIREGLAKGVKFGPLALWFRRKHKAESLSGEPYEVRGHEGRHRALAAMQSGEEKIPVAVFMEPQRAFEQEGERSTFARKSRPPSETRAAKKYLARHGKLPPFSYRWGEHKMRLPNPARFHELTVSYPIPVGLGPRGRYAIHGTDRAIVHHATAFSGHSEGKRLVGTGSLRSRELYVSYPDRRCAMLAIHSIRKLRVPGIRFRVEVVP